MKAETSEVIDPRPDIKVQIPLLFLTRIIMDTTLRSVYPFLLIFSRGMGIDVMQLSLALSWRGLVAAIGSLSASTADSLGRRKVMLIGFTAFTVGVSVIAIWPSFPAFVVFLMLLSLGMSAFVPAMQAYLGDLVSPKRRGLALAFSEMSWALAAIVCVPLVGLLIAGEGWRAPFQLLALLGVAALLVLIWLLPKESWPREKRPSVLANISLAFASRAALGGLLAAMMVHASHELFSIVFGVWMEESFNLKITALGVAATSIGFAELSGEGIGGAIIDRLGSRRSVSYGLVLMCLSALTLPLLGTKLSGALLGIFLFFLSLEFTFVSSLTLLAEIYADARATLISLAWASIHLVRGLVAPLGLMLYRIDLWAVSVTVTLFCLLGLFALRWSKTEKRGILADKL